MLIAWICESTSNRAFFSEPPYSSRFECTKFSYPVDNIQSTAFRQTSRTGSIRLVDFAVANRLLDRIAGFLPVMLAEGLIAAWRWLCRGAAVLPEYCTRKLANFH